METKSGKNIRECFIQDIDSVNQCGVIRYKNYLQRNCVNNDQTIDRYLPRIVIDPTMIGPESNFVEVIQKSICMMELVVPNTIKSNTFPR